VTFDFAKLVPSFVSTVEYIFNNFVSRASPVTSHLQMAGLLMAADLKFLAMSRVSSGA